MTAMTEVIEEKVAEADFEALLDEYEDLIVRRSKPGASTMNNAIHNVRTALLRAAQLGVNMAPGAVNPKNYRRALVNALAVELSPELPVPTAADIVEWLSKNKHQWDFDDVYPGTAAQRMKSAEGQMQIARVNPKAEIGKGMKAVANFGMVVPMASEFEKALAKVRKKYPDLEINISRATTTGWAVEQLEELAHALRLAGEEVYKARPTR